MDGIGPNGENNIGSFFYIYRPYIMAINNRPTSITQNMRFSRLVYGYTVSLSTHSSASGDMTKK